MQARVSSRHSLMVAGACWLAAAFPHVRDWLESSMTLHMLVQLPLLACIGFVCGRQLMDAPPRALARPLAAIQSCNGGGITGLIAAAFAMMLWMLPRSLDLARLDPMVDALKFLTVPAAGMAIALSWPRVPGIARAVVHLEAIATLLRFGWGYLAADERLCLAYLAGDQQRAGELLLWAGAAYAVAIVWRPVFGSGWENIFRLAWRIHPTRRSG